MRAGSSNPNWKGGLTKFRSADELLDMPEPVQEEVKRRLLRSSRRMPNGCWEWTGGVFKSNGRAKLALGRNFLAYRLMFVLTKGPTSGLLVIHSCDNPKCINPAHLLLGTNADNSADMVSKGRSLYGAKNPGAILTEAQVKELRKLVPDGKLYGRRAELAQRFGVCKESISRAVSGKSWRMLDA